MRTTKVDVEEVWKAATEDAPKLLAVLKPLLPTSLMEGFHDADTKD